MGGVFEGSTVVKSTWSLFSEDLALKRGPESDQECESQSLETSVFLFIKIEIVPENFRGLRSESNEIVYVKMPCKTL